MKNFVNNSDKIASGKVQVVEISAEHAGQRLDNFLISRLKGVPKSVIYRICRKGEVRVNKGRIKPDYRLVTGDQVRIPPVRLAERPEQEQPGDRILKLVESRILYEDNRLIVLNKPSGLAVHGGSGLKYGVIEAIRVLRPQATQVELVHRLDRDTSGCLLIAKKRSMLRRLHEQLRGTGMQKTYLALVKGRWQSGSRMVHAPLKKNTLSSGERIVRVDSKDGKEAKSEFSPRAVGDIASLMRVGLHTGRTHQIRVHASHEGHPIAGDDKYGDEDFNRLMKTYGLKRLFLHAFSLRFSLSEDEPPLYIEAPLDDDLQTVLNKLGLNL